MAASVHRRTVGHVTADFWFSHWLRHGPVHFCRMNKWPINAVPMPMAPIAVISVPVPATMRELEARRRKGGLEGVVPDLQN